MIIDARFRPQAQLAEVGASGMAKIFASRFLLSDQAEGAWLEALYLERAGAHVSHGESVASAPEPDFTHRGSFHFAASREAAAGSWRALKKLRSVLEL